LGHILAKNYAFRACLHTPTTRLPQRPDPTTVVEHPLLNWNWSHPLLLHLRALQLRTHLLKCHPCCITSWCQLVKVLEGGHVQSLHRNRHQQQQQ
jgi:hypothetical protein